ncbi:MAG: GntR family transcriptional regulator [Desulfobacterales bacterium]|jgi:DNA-binding GntR family transcriptional regulator|nr:GntR family transcriptional regulator [Desulfobacterales bacterium]
MYANENLPLYFRIYHKIRQDILDGEFERGGKIGIIEELSKKYGVATETMRRAIYLLETEGLVIRKQGRGTIIPENANLDPVKIGNLVVQKKITETVLHSDFAIISTDWIPAPRRFIKLYELDQKSSEPMVLKIMHTLKFKDNPEYRLCAAHYVGEPMLHTLKTDKTTAPLEVILALSKWIDTTQLKTTVSIMPHLCVDDIALLLGIPDGTPVFRNRYFVRDRKNNRHCWETISTANIHVHELDFE